MIWESRGSQYNFQGRENPSRRIKVSLETGIPGPQNGLPHFPPTDFGEIAQSEAEWYIMIIIIKEIKQRTPGLPKRKSLIN